MTDDIVADLRNRAKHCKEDLERDVEAFILRQAADEIERLRQELIQANNSIKLLIAIETAGKDS